MAEEQKQKDIEEVIGLYLAAKRLRDIIRRSIVIIIILIVAIYIGFIWKAMRDFQKEEFSAFSSALGAEATAYTPEIAAKMKEISDRLLPLYIEAMVNVYHRDQDKYLQVLVEEIDELDHYAKDSWPKIKTSLNELVSNQEKAARMALYGIISWS